MFLKASRFRIAACIVITMAMHAFCFDAYCTAKSQGVELNRIGYVDFQLALNSVSDGKAVKNRLKGEFKEKQKRLNELQDELRILKNTIDRESASLGAAELQARKEVYRTKFFELQQMYSAFKLEMSSREASLTRQILDRLKKLVRKIGEEEDYSLILEKSQDVVVYAPGGVDITKEVIRRYDGRGRRGGK